MDAWIARKIYGADTKKQSVSREDITRYQIEKINETLDLVRISSRFYQQKFQGIRSEPIRCLKDLEGFPFTEAAELAESGNKMVCVSQDQVKRIVTLNTSGTTGHPKRVFFTGEDQELTIDFFHYGMQYLIGRQDRFLILLPAKTPGCVGDLLRQGIERIGSYCNPYGLIDDYSRVARLMANERITSLVGNPVQILTLAEVSRHEGIKLEVQSLLLSTDYVPEALCRRLNHLWGCQVFEHYGMTETGLGGGVFCPALAGYHMREADLYFEVIDPDGHPVPDGEYGELVFTTLTRKAMPLIRYRTGDYGRWKTDPCSCGSSLKLMEKTGYRVKDGIRLGSENLLHITQLDEIIFSIEGILNYRAETDGKELRLLLMALSEEDGFQREELLKNRIQALFPHNQSLSLVITSNYSWPIPETALYKRKILPLSSVEEGKERTSDETDN